LKNALCTLSKLIKNNKALQVISHDQLHR